MDETTPARIAVFGAANLDLIARTSRKPVMGASNPGSVRVTVGGVGFNVGTILGRFGHSVRLVTRTGDDPHGETVRAAIRAAGIDISPFAVSRDRSTATYHALLDHRGDLIIGLAAMDIYDTMTPAALVPAVESARGDAIWVIDANLPAESIGYLLERAAAFGAFAVALPVSPAKAERLRDHLGQVSLLIANRREAAVLAGSESAPTEAAETLSERHALAAVITDGGNALAVHQAGKTQMHQPFSGPIASVNGAGDALAAGIVHGLAGGRELFQAIPTGLAAASLTLAHPESVPDSLTIAAIKRRIAAEPT